VNAAEHAHLDLVMARDGTVPAHVEMLHFRGSAEKLHLSVLEGR
jgi:hypothetical protein